MECKESITVNFDIISVYHKVTDPTVFFEALYNKRKENFALDHLIPFHIAFP